MLSLGTCRLSGRGEVKRNNGTNHTRSKDARMDAYRYRVIVAEMVKSSSVARRMYGTKGFHLSSETNAVRDEGILFPAFPALLD